MKILEGPPDSAAAGFPTLFPSRLRAYGAGPEHDRFLGCPAQYRAKYVEQSIHELPQPGGPREFGSALHEALFHMEQEMTGPEDALRAVWKPHIPLERWDEAVALLNGYLDRGGPMAKYGTLAVEIPLFAVLYEDEDFGPIYFGGIIDWLGLDVQQAQVVHLSDYKGLALDTLMPTPTGWVKMGEVQVGNQLFGGDGRPCSVTAKSEIHMNPCYRITFDDGSSVICDHEHRWVVKAGTIGGRRAPLSPVEMTTQEIVDRGITNADGQRDVRIENVEIEMSDADLPIDPYVLGCWLGDGTKAAGVVSSQDQRIFDEIAARGYGVGPVLGHKGRTIYGLNPQLRELGLLGCKQVPSAYMRGSRRQRLDLLRGLMDTDGYWNTTRQRAVMNTTQPWQAEAVQELVVSLGWKATTFDTIAKGFGVESPAQQVWFTPTEPVFLARPPTDFRPSTSTRPKRRLVLSIEKVDTVPTQCITVDSPDHRYLCTEHMIPTHNSNIRPLDHDEVRNDPQLRGYDWLVHQCWGELGLPGMPHTVAHMDALRWSDVEAHFTHQDRENFRDWAEAVARQILRDEVGEEIIGPGCRFCARKLNCDAYLSLPGDSEAIEVRNLDRSLEELWEWRKKAATFQKMMADGIKEVDALFKAEAQIGPLVIDGQQWVDEEATENKVDVEALHEIVGDAMFYDVASVTQKDLGLLVSAKPERAEEIMGTVQKMVIGRRVKRSKVKKEQQ